jgi:hypothetical protein
MDLTALCWFLLVILQETYQTFAPWLFNWKCLFLRYNPFSYFCLQSYQDMRYKNQDMRFRNPGFYNQDSKIWI